MNPTRRTMAPLGARAGLAALLGGLLATGSLVAAPAANAADEFLQISLDGTSFASSAAGPVFREGVGLVPGSATAGSIWVRNTGSEPAVLTAAVISRSLDQELSGYLAVDASGVGVPAPEASVIGPAGSCTELKLAVSIPAGGTQQVELAAGLRLDTPNAARSKQGSFDLLFVLDSAANADRPACDAAPAEPALPLPAERPTPVPPAGTSSVPSTTAASTGLPGAAAVLIAGTPAAGGAPALQPAQQPVRGQAEAAQAPAAGLPGATDAPPEITAAGFIESTVEPIIRTWQGTLMVLLAAAFFAAAAARTRVTRRTS